MSKKTDRKALKKRRAFYSAEKQRRANEAYYARNKPNTRGAAIAEKLADEYTRKVIKNNDALYEGVRELTVNAAMAENANATAGESFVALLESVANGTHPMFDEMNKNVPDRYPFFGNSFEARFNETKARIKKAHESGVVIDSSFVESLDMAAALKA